MLLSRSSASATTSSYEPRARTRGLSCIGGGGDLPDERRASACRRAPPSRTARKDAGALPFCIERSGRKGVLLAAAGERTAPKKLGRTRASKAKRKKEQYGKNRRILRAVRQAVPPGDGRAGQAGDRCRARHPGRHHRAGHGRVVGQEKDYDFFPLTVDFIEKMYAVGRIPGGYLKREARPSDKGTLTARMVDRPIRPGFADGFKREVHVVCTTLVVDSVNPPDTICVVRRVRGPHARARPPSTALPPACASAATSRRASSS